MKIFALFLLVCLFSVSVYGQKGKPADYYINFNKVDFNKTYINYQNIDSIFKDTKEGAIYIHTKDNNKPFSPLVEVLKKHTNYKSIRPSMIFRINNKTIYDIENITIDPTFYVYIEIDQAGMLDYLSKKYKDLLIVNISLEVEERKPKIMIQETECPVIHLKQESPIKKPIPRN